MTTAVLSKVIKQKRKYEKPSIKKEKSMNFPREIIEFFMKGRGKKIACRQCSSCHSCR